MNYLDGEVATLHNHVGQRMPRRIGRVKALGWVEPRDAVEATDGVEASLIGCHSHPAPSVSHWREKRPLVCFGVEHLGTV